MLGSAVDLSIDFMSGRAAANAIIRYVPVKGKYGPSKYTDEAFTVQKQMGKASESISTILTGAQTYYTLRDAYEYANKD